MKEGRHMKVLKIDNDQGFYYTIGKEYNPIDKINKDDLINLVELTLEEDVEFDEYSEEKIKNQAHQIIYKSIREKLLDLKRRKDEFKDESERLFLQEYEKYKGTDS
jgi:hypothetical protein